ncbi:unnamed protein product [Ostreobium quekettii]|uniref:Uncharacterized protein n=1 Tax=Ostreobium quekettii TaxID=121088 RepID=A0A8S1IJZ1_9CHLO|nr:unnamed protein product [Ostreobium quekettii]
MNLQQQRWGSQPGIVRSEFPPPPSEAAVAPLVRLGIGAGLFELDRRLGEAADDGKAGGDGSAVHEAREALVQAATRLRDRGTGSLDAFLATLAAVSWAPPPVQCPQGQGVFLELLEEAEECQDMLRMQMDSGEGMEEMYSCVCNVLRQLLEVVTDQLDESMVVSAVSPRGNTSHDTLRLAVQFLLLLVQTLPQEDVLYSVVRLLFGGELFLDFRSSDLQARAILLCGAFRLLDAMRQRGMDVTEVAKSINDLLGALIDEHERIAAVLRSPIHCRANPLNASDLPWRPHWFPLYDEYLTFLNTMQRGDQDLIVLVLMHMQRVLCSLSPAARQGGGELVFIGQPLMKLLQMNTTFEPVVQSNALAVLNIRLSTAMATHSENSSLFKRHLATRFTPEVLQTLEALVVMHFPGRTGRQGDCDDASKPASRDSQIISMKIEVLSRAVALIVQTGGASYSFVEQQAFKPYGCDAFWENASVGQRCFALLFLAGVLEHLPQEAVPATATPDLLRIWLKSSFDFGGQLCFAHFTAVLAMQPCTAGAFEGVRVLEELLGDGCMEARRGLLERVAAQLRSSEAMGGHLPLLCDRLDKVISARDRELRQNSTPTTILRRHHWHQQATGMLLSLLREGGPSRAFSSPSRPPFVQPTQGLEFLGCCAHWVYESIRFLEDEYFRLGPQGAQNTLGPFTNVRKVLEERATAHVTRLFAAIINMGAPEALPQSQPLLRPLQILLSSCMEVPMAAWGINPVDSAIFEAFATALDPDVLSNVLGDAGGSHGWGQYMVGSGCAEGHSGREEEDPGGHAVGLLHFILRSFVWHFLDRTAYGTASADRVGVNTLQFLKMLLSTPGLQNIRLLEMFLPCMLGGVMRVIRPEHRLDPSRSCKIAAYDLLTHLFQQHPDLIGPPPTRVNDLEISGSVSLRNGPLQTAALPSKESLSKALSLVLSVCLRDLLGCIRDTMTDEFRIAADRMERSTSLLNEFKPLQSQDGGRIQASLMVLFGQPPQTQHVEKILRTSPVIVPNVTQSRAPEHGTRLHLAKQALGLLDCIVRETPDGASWGLRAIPPLRDLLSTGSQPVARLRDMYERILRSLASHGMAVDEFKLAVTDGAPPNSITHPSGASPPLGNLGNNLVQPVVELARLAHPMGELLHGNRMDTGAVASGQQSPLAPTRPFGVGSGTARSVRPHIRAQFGNLDCNQLASPAHQSAGGQELVGEFQSQAVAESATPAYSGHTLQQVGPAREPSQSQQTWGLSDWRAGRMPMLDGQGHAGRHLDVRVKEEDGVQQVGRHGTPMAGIATAGSSAQGTQQGDLPTVKGRVMSHQEKRSKSRQTGRELKGLLVDVEDSMGARARLLLYGGLHSRLLNTLTHSVSPLSVSCTHMRPLNPSQSRSSVAIFTNTDTTQMSVTFVG